MRHFDTYGIKILYNGKVIRHQVNPTTAGLLEKTLAVLAKQGCVAIHTLGIRNNRTQRNSNKTSTHADGVAPAYEEWPDATNGCRALDIVAAEFADGIIIDVTNNRPAMIAFCEDFGWTVYHKKPLKWGDHLHVESALLT